MAFFVQVNQREGEVREREWEREKERERSRESRRETTRKKIRDWK